MLLVRVICIKNDLMDDLEERRMDEILDSMFEKEKDSLILSFYVRIHCFWNPMADSCLSD